MKATAIRRYVVLIQDDRGYPPAGELEAAPPEGPTPPVLHEAVLADDFERVEAERDQLRGTLRVIADMQPVQLNPDGADQAAQTMQLVASEALAEDGH